MEKLLSPTLIAALEYFADRNEVTPKELAVKLKTTRPTVN
jgi:DNA-binding MarR family transcriptional regulator